MNIGSVNAYIARRSQPYSVWGGLTIFTKNAASLGTCRDSRDQINPGWTLTDGEGGLAEGRARRGSTRRSPRGRSPARSPHDIAAAAAYFASDDSAMVSGAVLDLDQQPVGAPSTSRRTVVRRCLKLRAWQPIFRKLITGLGRRASAV